MGERLGVGAESANHRAISPNLHQWESAWVLRQPPSMGERLRTFAPSTCNPLNAHIYRRDRVYRFGSSMRGISYPPVSIPGVFDGNCTH